MLDKEIPLGSRIDCHTHAGGECPYEKFYGFYPFVQSVCDLRLKQLLLGINNTIVFPMPGTYYYKMDRETGNNWNPSGLMDFPYEVENEALLREIEIARQLYPEGRILPFMNINPREGVERQIDHLEELMKKYEFYGLKFHSSAANTSASELIDSPFIQFMEYYDLPLIVHSGVFMENAHPSHPVALAQAHPGVRVSIAHLAGWDNGIFAQIDQLPNIYLDCSPYLASFKAATSEEHKTFVAENKFPSSFEDPVETLIELNKRHRGRLLWGTDEPWTTYNFDTGELILKVTYKDEVDVLNRMREGGYQSDLEEIVSENPIRFITGG